MAGILEYMEAHNLAAGQQETDTREAQHYESRKRDTEQARADFAEAQRLKDEIISQLEQGTAPQVILLEAIDAIRYYSGDYDYCREQLKTLKPIYEAYQQQNLFIDQAAQEMAALEAKREDTREKLQKQVAKWIKNSQKDIKKANDLWQRLAEVDETEEDDKKTD